MRCDEYSLRRAGSAHQIFIYDDGTPLNIFLTGTKQHDSMQLLPLLDGMQPIAGRRSHPLT